MEVIRYKEDHIVSPDCCVIPEWGLHLSCMDNRNMTIALCNDKLFCSHYEKHIFMEYYKQRKPDDIILEVRAWDEKKIISLWTPSIRGYIKDCLMEIKDRLAVGDYVELYGFPNPPTDLSDYHIIFTIQRALQLFIVNCVFDELNKIDEYAILDNSIERQWHILLPIEKYMHKKNNWAAQRAQYEYYYESIEMWKNKAGDMDIAKYHLLMYEE